MGVLKADSGGGQSIEIRRVALAVRADGSGLHAVWDKQQDVGLGSG